MAGTIAQDDRQRQRRGRARLLRAPHAAVKVLNRYGWGTLANVAEGVRFAADHGAQVINLSLGGDGKSRILEEAVNHALAKGVVVVAAAGNSGKKVGYPAGYPGVIAVSATDSSSDKIAWFSSRGPQIAIAAPGVNVTQQTICEAGRNKCELFGSFSGTSMASPHVAGAAAMLVGLGVSGPEAMRDGALARGARPMGDPSLYGAGILSASGSAVKVFWSHLGVRMLALLVLAGLPSRGASGEARRARSARGRACCLEPCWASVGLLFFLPLVHALPRLGEHRWIGELLDAARRRGGTSSSTRESAPAGCRSPSALPAVVAAAVLYGVKSLRSTLGGFALGSAALMTQIAWAGDVGTPFGTTITRLWLAGNVMLCVWLARVVLDRKKA